MLAKVHGLGHFQDYDMIKTNLSVCGNGHDDVINFQFEGRPKDIKM